MSKDLVGEGLPARVEQHIGKELLEVEEIYFSELESCTPYVSDVLAHVTKFRGKRLRPMLLLLSASAVGEITHEHKVLGAVVEMIHTATLVHDDVLDEAETRRHVATVNSRWNNETSVLFGDFLFTHAFHLASCLETTAACRLIGRATNIVCEGELSQIHERGNCDLTEESYLGIIERKTAELCAVCSLLGARYAGAEHEVVHALENYGRDLGIAFQISDDLLDILGSEAETGKSLGSDFKKQNLTLPLIHLLRCADEATAARIRELLANPDDRSWSELQAFLQRSDSVQYSRLRAEGFAARARRSLDCLDDSPGKRILEEVADFAVQRSF